MDWTSLLEFVERHGLPLVALIAFLVAGKRAVVWLVTNVVKPAADRHIQYIDATEKCMEKQTEAIHGLYVCQDKQSETLRILQETQQKHFDVCRGVHRPGEIA